mgnify:CR=1 FL=1
MIRADGLLYERVRLDSDRDVAGARRAVTKAMSDLGAKALKKTRFVTAVSEIARNAIVHGGGGELQVFTHDAPKEVIVICADEGQGICDVETALQDGFTTGSGMGRGLGGAQRLCDAFEIETTTGNGEKNKKAEMIRAGDSN